MERRRPLADLTPSQLCLVGGPPVVHDSDIPKPTMFADIPERYRNDIPDPDGKAEALVDTVRKIICENSATEGHRQRLFVVGCGGTFQSEPSEQGLRPGGSLEATIHSLPIERSLLEQVHLSAFELFKKDSSQMTVWHWRILAEVIAYVERMTPRLLDGYIVTHGTDTMDDAGANLSFFLHQLKRMLVITGSQQPASSGGDAAGNWKRCLQLALIAAESGRRISEKVILCGTTAARATRSVKVSDFEEAYQSFDGNPLVDFAKDTDFRRLKMPPWARSVDPGFPFRPIIGPIDDYANLDELSMRGMSREEFARRLREARAAIVTLLGSATAPDDLADELAKADAAGKMIVMAPPFPRSRTEIGHYEAGRGLARVEIPYLGGTSAALRAKLHYVMSILGIEPTVRDERFGPVLKPREKDLTFMFLCTDLAGEFQRLAAD